MTLTHILHADMDPEQLAEYTHLQDMGDDDEIEPPNFRSHANVLDGSERIDISHAGGEFQSLEEGIEEEADDSDDELGDVKHRCILLLDASISCWLDTKLNTE